MDTKEQKGSTSTATDNVETMALSPAVETALSEVIPSDDPLDSPEFDPIAYINETFPDENSLAGGHVDAFLGKLRRRVAVLSDGITKDVRDHSCQRTRTKKAIVDATGAIQELFTKIQGIKDKAGQSEVMVQEICRDIKSLDFAKKHLTDTIRALRNLHMLVSALEQLERMANDKKYQEAAQLLKAVGDLFTLFTDYANVPKIRSLLDQVERIKDQITEQIISDFHTEMPNGRLRASSLGGRGDDDTLDDVSLSFGQGPPLLDACAVVDALDLSVKNKILRWFIGTQLEPYDLLFSLNKEGGTLDQTERRYAWLRRVLRNYDDMESQVFPDDWAVKAIISRQFCLDTSQHLSDILRHANGNYEVTTLVNALQKTIDFEKELTSRFKKEKTNTILGYFGHGTSRTADHRKESKHREAKQDCDDDNNRNNTQDNAADDDDSHNNQDNDDDAHKQILDFSRLISDSFSPYMSGYVTMERESIAESIARIALEEQWDAGTTMEAEELYSVEGVTKTFEESDKLLLYIRTSYKRCARLTTGETFYDMSKEYTRGLSSYCQLLERHLPNDGKDSAKQLSAGEIRTSALIVNTAEYCAEAGGNLEKTLQKIVDEKWSERIDLTSIQEQFSALANKGITCIVDSLMSKLSIELNVMSKMQWASWESVGDQSPYVNSINRIINEDVPQVAMMTSAAYFCFCFNQIVCNFIPKYVESIFRCKLIGEMGAQQMRLDAHAIKSILINIPSLHPNEKKNSRLTSRFKRYVGREMGKAEALLKTLVSVPERLIVTFKALLPKGKAHELVQIMRLRGLKKSEQQTLLETYNAQAGVEDRIDVSEAMAVPNDSGSSTFSNLFGRLA